MMQALRITELDRITDPATLAAELDALALPAPRPARVLPPAHESLGGPARQRPETRSAAEAVTQAERARRAALQEAGTGERRRTPDELAEARGRREAAEAARVSIWDLGARGLEQPARIKRPAIPEPDRWPALTVRVKNPDWQPGDPYGTNAGPEYMTLLVKSGAQRRKEMVGLNRRHLGVGDRKPGETEAAYQVRREADQAEYRRELAVRATRDRVTEAARERGRMTAEERAKEAALDAATARTAQHRAWVAEEMARRGL